MFIKPKMIHQIKSALIALKLKRKRAEAGLFSSIPSLPTPIQRQYSFANHTILPFPRLLANLLAKTDLPSFVLLCNHSRIESPDTPSTDSPLNRNDSSPTLEHNNLIHPALFYIPRIQNVTGIHISLGDPMGLRRCTELRQILFLQ